MTIKDLIDNGFEPVLVISENTEIKTAYTSDLLSDVLANGKEDSLLITIQAHKNTVAVSSIVGIKAIIICNNRRIPDDMKQLALNEKVSILRTKDDQFKTSYIVYKLIYGNE
ncbi:MAG: DRTGG domain-containing protein [Brevinematales bacterium]